MIRSQGSEEGKEGKEAKCDASLTRLQAAGDMQLCSLPSERGKRSENGEREKER